MPYPEIVKTIVVGTLLSSEECAVLKLPFGSKWDQILLHWYTLWLDSIQLDQLGADIPCSRRS